jgi:hypothetical protein
MKNSYIKYLAALSILLSCWAVPLKAQPSFAYREDIIVTKEQTQKNIFALGSNVIVEGQIKENIIAIGGSISLGGTVKDSVVGIGATITLQSTAVVNGDVVCLGGILKKEPGCIIEGDTIYFKGSDAVLKFFKRGIFSINLIPLILIFKLITIFIWLLIAVVMAAIFPRQISFAAEQVRKSFWPVVGTGFLALLVFIGVTIFAAILCFILIGIPLLLFLVALGLVIKIFGRVVLFHFFGESLLRGFGRQKPAPLLAVILGLLIVSLIGFVPLLGFLFSFCLSVIGWGVVIRTKFGTTENWFRRKPAA